MDGLTKESIRQKYEDITQLLASKEWDHWVEFMRRRRMFFQNKLNGAVRSQDLIQAEIYLALMEDSEAMLSEFKKETKRIEKEISNEVE